MVEGITERLGSNIWSNAFVAFTHAKGSSLPDGLTYGEPSFMALRTVLRSRRALNMQSQALHRHAGCQHLELHLHKTVNKEEQESITWPHTC